MQSFVCGVDKVVELKESSVLLEEANKLDDGYDLYKDIGAIAEYAKTHNIAEKGVLFNRIRHQDLEYSHVRLGIKIMDELPRRVSIYHVRLLNCHRIPASVDEFIDIVLEFSMEKVAKRGYLRIVEATVKEFEGEEARKRHQRKREILENAPIPKPVHYGDIYSIFEKFNDYVFQNWVTANFFMNEPELAMIGTVFDEFSPEVNPDKIKRIEDLTKKDVIRLLRVVNSFRRKDIVDKFLTDIGDFDNLHDLFNLFVGYVFQEYKNANYFLNEPELSTDPKCIPWQITMFGRPVVIESPHSES